VVFTDLDGTLLDHDDYSCNAAAWALDRLARRGVPLVLCSSKTRAEIDLVQRQLGLRHPFISENGGALFVPRGYFPFPLRGTRPVNGWDVMDFGKPYGEVVNALRRTATRLGMSVTGFCDMSAEEVADLCHLPLPYARLAKLREYDEPFRLPGTAPADRSRLFRAVREEGLRCMTGARFDHATGATDKGLGVIGLRGLYERQAGESVLTVGLGDGLNDVPMLQEVDIPAQAADRARHPAGRAGRLERGDPRGAPRHRAAAPARRGTSARGMT
jgi:mannosyl-3-phosphoglycerate phosphatase